MVYRINMRKAISITLSEENLLWLRGQAARSARGSVSELLDGLVAEARQGGRTDPSAIRSIVGTVDIPDDDPELRGADGYIRTMFSASLREPIVVRERPSPARKGRPGKKRG